MSIAITARLHKTADRDTCLRFLRDLPALTQHSPFISLSWYASWLTTTENHLHAVSFWRNQQLVGFTTLGVSRQKRWLPWLTIAHQNQTGIAALDQVWVEDNHILCAAEDHSDCVNALLALVFSELNVATLAISMASDETDWLTMAARRGITVTRQEHAAYRTHLSPITNWDSVLSKLSKNTRYQLRRAWKHTTRTRGTLTVEAAGSAEERLQYLNALANWHKERWQHTREGSGFSNPAFVQHHQHLLTHYPNQTAILRVKAGETTLGYCYYLLCNTTAYFYCSGINYSLEDVQLLKPGYLVHVMCIMHFAERNFSDYDYLAGDSQYKRSLSDQSYSMYNLELFNPNWKGRAIQGLKRLKAALGQR